jgi:hypothetical protein
MKPEVVGLRMMVVFEHWFFSQFSGKGFLPTPSGVA